MKQIRKNLSCLYNVFDQHDLLLNFAFFKRTLYKLYRKKKVEYIVILSSLEANDYEVSSRGCFGDSFGKTQETEFRSKCGDTVIKETKILVEIKKSNPGTKTRQGKQTHKSKNIK